MRFRTYGLSCACLLALAVSILGCNNTLNPLCGSARPAPLIGSLSPSTMTVAQLQQGETLTINGSNFVSSSEVLINSTPLGANVVSPQVMTVNLTTDVITGPGPGEGDGADSEREYGRFGLHQRWKEQRADVNGELNS